MSPAQRSFHETVFHSLPNHVAIVDQDGKLLGLNAAWDRFVELTGATKPTLGSDYIEFCRKELGSNPDQAQAILSVLRGEQRLTVLEFPAPDRLHWHLMRVTPLGPEQHGAVIVYSDITKRKRMQAELEEERAALEQRVEARTQELTQAVEQLRHIEACYRALQASVPDLLVRVNQDGFLTECYAPGTVSPTPAQQWLGRPLAKVFSPELAEKWLKAIHQTSATQVLQVIEGSSEIDGAARDLEIRVIRIDEAETLSMVRDVTQQRTVQAMVEKQRTELAHLARVNALGELASGLAHEINQPLSAIVSYARGCFLRMQTNQSRPTEIMSALEEVILQAERAGEIVRRLRNFVQRREPTHAIVKTGDLVQQVLALLRPEIRMMNVTVQVDQPSVPLFVEGDSVQLEQVIFNLLCNAIEAMVHVPITERIVQITICRLASEKIRISIRDHGPGLAEDAPRRIFEPFFSTKPNGMGMGLAISRSIVEAHGGTIAASNHPQGGAIFDIVLPWIAAKD